MTRAYSYTDKLETSHLVTRFLTREDIPAWVNFFLDTEGTKYLHVASHLPPEERATEWINFSIKRYEENRYGLQALIEKHTGAFVGICGLLLQDINGSKEIEIGYHLMKEHRGKGYATEAARAFKDYAFGQDITNSVISIINPENRPSKNVAKRNGMQLSANNVPFRDHLYDIFRIDKEEWETQRGPAIP
jgi:ribosomal-protein-alanine N-acetyltransferase